LVEYFIGSKKGKILHRLFSQNNHTFFTCCVAEIIVWALE
jgi:hypothetical protein